MGESSAEWDAGSPGGVRVVDIRVQERNEGFGDSIGRTQFETEHGAFVLVSHRKAARHVFFNDVPGHVKTDPGTYLLGSKIGIEDAVNDVPRYPSGIVLDSNQ